MYILYCTLSQNPLLTQVMTVLYIVTFLAFSPSTCIYFFVYNDFILDHSIHQDLLKCISFPRLPTRVIDKLRLCLQFHYEYG